MITITPEPTPSALALPEQVIESDLETMAKERDPEGYAKALQEEDDIANQVAKAKAELGPVKARIIEVEQKITELIAKYGTINSIDELRDQENILVRSQTDIFTTGTVSSDLYKLYNRIGNNPFAWVKNRKIARLENEISQGIAQRKTLEQELVVLMEQQSELENQVSQNPDQPMADFLEATKKAMIEEESLRADMSAAHDEIDSERREYIKKQRVQELVEREMNSRLLTVDDLEEEVIAENPEVAKRSVPYKNREIVVYDLKGLPFGLLTHNVGYKLPLRTHEGDLSRSLFKDPSIWLNDRYQLKNIVGGANYISMSYTDSWLNFKSRHYSRDNENHNLTYGFSHVDGGSILRLINGDGSTRGYLTERDLEITNIDALDIISSPLGMGYNEIVSMRYSENGYPKRPDYIVTQDGAITETMLHHADFFGIPIVNIESKNYVSRFNDHVRNVYKSIVDIDDYPTFMQIMNENNLLNSNSFDIKLKNSLNYNTRIDGPLLSANEVNDNTVQSKIIDLEFTKRTEFIENTLEKVLASIQDGNIDHLNVSYDTITVDCDGLVNGVKYISISKLLYGSFSIHISFKDGNEITTGYVNAALPGQTLYANSQKHIDRVFQLANDIIEKAKVK